MRDRNETAYIPELCRRPCPFIRDGRCTIYRPGECYCDDLREDVGANRNADCGMRNADSARREEPRPGPVRNPQSEIRDPQSTDPQSTDREVD